MKLVFILLILFPAITFSKGYGIVTVIKGKALVVDSVGVKRDLKKGEKIFETDTVMTSATAVVRLVMMDTNIIDIYPNSKLLIKEYVYNPKEDEKNVKLEVTAGRIKSTVKQKYDNDKNKYNVRTPVIVAGVRGTTFTAEHEIKSGLSRVRTLEGNVMVGRPDAQDQVKEFFSVKANQTIQMDQRTEKPEVKDVPKIEIEREKEKDKKEGFTAVAPSEPRPVGNRKEINRPADEPVEPIREQISINHRNTLNPVGGLPPRLDPALPPPAGTITPINTVTPDAGGTGSTNCSQFPNAPHCATIAPPSPTQ